MKAETKGKTRNPCEMQGSWIPQRAVVLVELAQPEHVKSKRSPTPNRSVAQWGVNREVRFLFPSAIV